MANRQIEPAAAKRAPRGRLRAHQRLCPACTVLHAWNLSKDLQPCCIRPLI